MANHKSAEKRARQTIKKNARNTNVKSAIKTAEKKVLEAITSKSKDAQNVLKVFVKQAMSATSKGTFKKTTISRKISRLSKRVQAALSK